MKAYHLLMGFLLSAILIGVTWGETTEEAKYIYNMDQKVQGDGFFNSYQDIRASELLLNNLDHGSGNYDGESECLVQNQARYTNTMEVDLTNQQLIKFNKSTDYTYAASSFDFGRSFRAAAFQSKGQEGTFIKNYEGSDRLYLGGTSMDALFQGLDVLSSNISAELSFNQKSADDDDYILVSFNSTGSIMLNLESAFTGKGHIGMLSAINETGKGHFGVPEIEIDEDYIGTFSLSKKMSDKFEYNWMSGSDDWLPCCSGGWNDMSYRAKKDFGYSANDVFDCTCFSLPGQTTKGA